MSNYLMYVIGLKNKYIPIQVRMSKTIEASTKYNNSLENDLIILSFIFSAY